MNENVDVNVSDDEWLNNKLNEDNVDNVDADVWLNNKLNDEVVSTALGNKIATMTEPEPNYYNNVNKFLADMSYYSDEIKTGVYRGGALALTSTAKFVADITESPDMKEWLDDADSYLNKLLDTTSKVGEVSETAGRVGLGLALTGGLGVSTIPARMAQGFTIDLLAFEGKSGNIADVFDEYDIPLGGVVDALKTDMSDTELESRLKNAFGGALVGGALETVVAGFRFGKDLVKSNSIKLEGDDAKVISTVINAMKEEANQLNSLKKEFKIDETTSLTKAQFNEGEAIFNRATEMIKDVPENFDELAKQGEQIVKQSEQVDATLNLKQPLNAEKITPTNAETLAKTTQDIEADATFESHKNLLKRADKDLKDKLGQEGYDVVKDLTETADVVSNLSLKVTQARVVVGNLTDKYQQALEVARKENSSESMVRAMLSLDNLVMVSRTLKNTTSSVAKAMSAMRINTESSNLFNSLKILDNIDSDYSMSLLRDAFSKNNADEVFKIMENFSDASKKMKDHIDNYQDGLFKKVGNVLSEGMIASMLSSASTMAINVVGNSFVKHQRLLQDSLQFLSGQVMKSSDRMKYREFRYLMNANIIPNGKTISIVGKNIKEWAKSGFKDETFDEAVLARYVQDQEHQHKYISSQYIRGLETGNVNSTVNNMINTYGKLARSPYKVIGAIDDYYKREAFRSELIRVGSRLADARGITDDMYNEFLDKFIRVNTELHILRNNGHKPTTSWVKANKNYIGTGEGMFKFADEARDHANYMTFQTELKGAVGNVVDALNSDGFLRILIPFKTSPINMLKMSVSQALVPLKKQIYKDIASGGVKRDIALAKLTYSSSVLTGLGFLISSGNVTGSFSQEERVAMNSAGVPEFSFRVGNTWYEYKQLEPIATILGVMTDLYKVQQGAMLRKDDLFDDPSFNSFADEIGTVLGDVGMSIVNNIVNKTYAKSLSDTMSLMNGDGNLVDYSGNLLSSAVPFSSLATFVGRNFGDGYKKEQSEFSEKLLGKYRVFLERDALDAYGRKIDEVKYTPVLTKKSIIDTHENRGALEVARLGINVHKMSKVISYQGIPIKLKPEEYHAMRRSLHEDFQLTDRMNSLVDSPSYKNTTDFARKEALTSLINQIKVGASTKILSNPKVTEELQKGVKKVVKEVTTVEPKKDYNNFIIGGINE